MVNAAGYSLPKSAAAGTMRRNATHGKVAAGTLRNATNIDSRDSANSPDAGKTDLKPNTPTPAGGLAEESADAVLAADNLLNNGGPESQLSMVSSSKHKLMTMIEATLDS